MMEKRRARAALSVVAAVAGTGYASGRELVLFFAQLGRLSWAGILLASAVFGALVGLMSCASAPRRWYGRVAAALRGLLLAAVAAVMLLEAGKLGALTLPARNGFLWGMLLALALALLANAWGLRPLCRVGFGLLLWGVVFYAALALDARPVRIHLRGDVRLALEDNPAAAALLALLYGSMNACVAAGIAGRYGRGNGGAARFGMLCGGMLCALLLCANAAIARGGRQLLAQALPVVLLSARWGLAGFWMTALFSYICAAATLAAALGGLWELAKRRPFLVDRGQA